jgi:hypothetical protein
LLVQLGGDPWQKGDDGGTPLHVASVYGQVSIIQEYINLCKDMLLSLDVEDSSGETPLFWAAEHKDEEAVTVLIAAGANTQHRSRTGQTLLMRAASNSNEFLLKALDLPVDVNACECVFKETALHMAVNAENLPACEFLLSRGADPNAQCRGGWTPLVDASIYCNVKLEQLMLEKGADPNIEDWCGRTVFDYLESSDDVAKVLQPYSNTHKLLTSTEKDTKLRNCLRKLLAQIFDVVPVNLGLQTYHFSLVRYFWLLARCFFLMKDYDTMRLCLETESIKRTRKLAYGCDLCGLRHQSSFFFCKICNILRCVCPSCYEARKEGKIIARCKIEHEYMEIGGEEWAKLPPGKIAKDGKTVEQFIAELKEKYCKEDEEDAGNIGQCFLCNLWSGFFLNILLT